jgi:uncharacterized Zn finger protein
LIEAMAFFYRDYVSVAERRRQAEREVQRLKRAGEQPEPVALDPEQRQIATTFWGRAWCRHLESYADFESRLGRGRSYVKNGYVVDLKLARGKVTARVLGSSLYRIEISIRPLPAARWRAVVAKCSGRIDSLVELLSGRMSDAVMGVVTDRETGLFPSPAEIQMQCSCPDWAGLCKHLAATLYGIGARFDRSPELLFSLRGVDPDELVERAAAGTRRITSRDGARKLLPSSALSDIFGIAIEAAPRKPPRPKKAPVKKRRAARR